MRTDMRKTASHTIAAILLAGTFSCASMFAQASGGGEKGGGQVAAPNPYIQSAPSAGAAAMPAGLTPTNGMTGQEMGNSSSMSAVFYPDIKTYVLSAGDLLNVHLYGVMDYNVVLRLSSDGTGQLPLIGTVNLAGLTIEKAQTRIEDLLKSAGMYRNPQIIITLGEYDDTQNSVLFTGDLHGRVPVRKAHTLAEALNLQGGLPPGSSSIVSIIRPGVAEPILVDLGTSAKDMAKADIPLQARDTIFVQRAGAIYVVGAFQHPGVFTMQPGRTTLLQLAALTGGPMYAAKYEDMRIIRTVGEQRTEVKVDIRKVLYGKSPDPIMEPGDIIFLPTSSLKAAIASGGLATLIGLANIAVTVATR